MATFGLLASHSVIENQTSNKPGKSFMVKGVGLMSPASPRRHQIYRWDFDVFEFNRESGERPLSQLTLQLLEDQQLLDGWLLDRATVEKYLTKVEGMYRPNPYHNKIHAADVTQTAAVIMSALDMHLRSDGSSKPASGNGCQKCSCGPGCCCAVAAKGPAALSNGHSPAASPRQPASNSSSVSSSAEPGLSKLERFAIILASAIHDLGHPGVNNVFLVKTRDKQAIMYNDKSVNENMHASMAFSLAFDQEESNIFKKFSATEYEQVRKLVLDMVLQTDMDVHFTLLEKFNVALTAVPDVHKWTALEQRSLLFQMLVHLADLANPSRPWPLALNWAEWVVTEFMQQGVREAQAGIPVSDFCNKEKVCMPAAQLFFIERFMQPTLEAFKPAAPSFYAMAMPWLADTKAKWTVFKEAGVRLPKQGYPTLQDSSPGLAKLSAALICCPACCGTRH